MRAATLATFVTLFGAGCQVEATGILLRVVADQERVQAADRLQVFVGYDTTAVARGLEVHTDDGRMTAFDVGSLHDAVEIILTDNGAPGPFWLGVRAINSAVGDGAAVLGEGGVDTTLEFVPGVLFEVDVVVASTTEDLTLDRRPEVMPRCPGWTTLSGDRHHIVAGIDTIDCDEDGSVWNGGATDCDDFDASFNPNAVDTLCDHVDHTCGRNPVAGSTWCLQADPTQAGRCLLGETACVDNAPPAGTCVGTDGVRLPLDSCAQCLDKVGAALFDCLKSHATVEIACAIPHDGVAICPTANAPPVFSQPAWWLDAGGAAAAGNVSRWLSLGPDPAIQYGWAQFPMGVPTISTATDEVSPSPALRIEGGVAILGADYRETRFALVTSGSGNTDLFRVDFDFKLEAGMVCQSQGAVDHCPSWPRGP